MLRKFRAVMILTMFPALLLFGACAQGISNEPQVTFLHPFDGKASYAALWAEIDSIPIADVQRIDEVISWSPSPGGLVVETNTSMTEQKHWLMFRVAGTDDLLLRGNGTTSDGIDYWIVYSNSISELKGKTIEAFFHGENGKDIVVFTFVYEGKRIYINID